MPNWCKGNIRLRGKNEDIKAFLANELEGTAYNSEYDIVATPPIIRDICGDGLSIEVKPPNEGQYCALYIKNTRRNFIDRAFEVEFCDDGRSLICIDNFSAAWGIEPEPYVELSKKYNLDIKLYGIECGMEFVQEIEIINGELKRNETIEYDDWGWECPFPNMGG